MEMLEKPSIFFYGLHKSGTTLFRKCLLDNIDGYRHVDYAADIFIEKNLKSITVEEKNYVYGPLYIETRISEKIKDFFQKDFIKDRKCWFLIRDPRDILISQYYSFGFTHVPPVNPDKLRDFLKYREIIQSQDIDEYSISAFQELLKRCELASEMIDACSDKLVIKYEDVVNNFFSFLSKISEDVHLSENCIFDFFENSRPNKEENLASHKRSGAVGQYKEKLRPETVKILNNNFKTILKKFDYEL